MTDNLKEREAFEAHLRALNHEYSLTPNADLLFACREVRLRLLGIAGMERWVSMLDDAIVKATGSRA